MQPRNNQLVICAGAILGFLCAIPVPWYTLTDGKLPNGRTFPGTLTVSGINGYFTLLLETPIWLLLAISAFATVVAAFNALRWTSVPTYFLALGLIVPGVDYVTPFFMTDEHLSLAVGPALAVFATLAALGVVFVNATVPRVRLGTAAAPSATSLWR